jgi:hypothetical protein
VVSETNTTIVSRISFDFVIKGSTNCLSAFALASSEVWQKTHKEHRQLLLVTVG